MCCTIFSPGLLFDCGRGGGESKDTDIFTNSALSFEMRLVGICKMYICVREVFMEMGE